MVILHFLMQSRRQIDVAFFNHDTSHSKKAQNFVKKFCAEHKLILTIGRVKGMKGKRSLEEFWRNERYAFFDSLGSDFVITCHHLDDVLETWLMSSFHGTPKVIPYNRNPNIYRPFLLTEKRSLISYCEKHKIEWIDDPSNKSVIHARNRVRHNIIPEVLKVNPGIRKVIRKKLVQIYDKV